MRLTFLHLFMLTALISACSTSEKDVLLTGGNTKMWMLEDRELMNDEGVGYWGLNRMLVAYHCVMELGLEDHSIKQWYFGIPENYRAFKSGEDRKQPEVVGSWQRDGEDLSLKLKYQFGESEMDSNQLWRIRSLDEDELVLEVLDHEGELWVVETYVPYE